MGPQLIASSSRVESFVEFTQDTHHVEAEEEEFDGETWSSRSTETSTARLSGSHGAGGSGTRYIAHEEAVKYRRRACVLVAIVGPPEIARLRARQP